MSDDLKADCLPVFETCPRCGHDGFERLSTHGYCVECNYFRLWTTRSRRLNPRTDW